MDLSLNDRFIEADMIVMIPMMMEPVILQLKHSCLKRIIKKWHASNILGCTPTSSFDHLYLSNLDYDLEINLEVQHLILLSQRFGFFQYLCL